MPIYPNPTPTDSLDMPRLTEAVKTEIVLLLAGFHSPTGVAVRLRVDLGIEVHRSQVIRYDPTKPCYEGGDRWREIFRRARERHIEEIASIPIAHMGFRLNQLQEIMFKAKDSGNIRLAMRAIAQAAREVGSNPIARAREPERPTMSMEEQRAAVARILDRALSQIGPEVGAARSSADTEAMPTS